MDHLAHAEKIIAQCMSMDADAAAAAAKAQALALIAIARQLSRIEAQLEELTRCQRKALR